MEYLVYIMGAIAGVSTGMFVLLMLFEFLWGPLGIYIGTAMISSIGFGWWMVASLMRGH